MSSDIPEAKKVTLASVRKTISTSTRILTIIWKHERNLLLISGFLHIAPALLPFINAYIYKLIVDEIVIFVQTGTFNSNFFYWLFFARAVSYFVSDVAYRLESFSAHHLWNRVPMIFQSIFLKKISQLDIQYFENSEFKNLLEKAREGLWNRAQHLTIAVFNIIDGILRVSIAAVALYKLNPYLILIIALILIPELIIQTRISQVAWGIWNWKSPLRKRYWDLLDILQDARMITESKLYNLSQTFLSEIQHILKKFYKQDSVVAKKNLGLQTGLNLFSSISYIGIELYTVSLVFSKKITVGDIGFYSNIISNFRSGFSGFLRNIGDVFDTTQYLDTFFEIIDIPQIIQEPAHPTPLNLTHPPLIEFRHVDFSYPGSDMKVLDDFNVTIAPGQKVALVGENGAGKSTIVKLLARLYDVTAGEILINGIPLTEVSIREWHDALAILLQSFNKYNYSVEDNIRFGNIHKKANSSNIRDAARSASADEFIQKYPSGYKQMLGRTFDDGIDPSGGQWQKIAIARAFYRDAHILILDEPTASIDARAEKEIFDRVDALSENMTTIIISHRFSTVRKADRILVIENGKIVEEGTHKELMMLEGRYEKLFTLQAEGYE